MASKRETGRTLVGLRGGPFDGQSTMLGTGNTLTFTTATHCGMYKTGVVSQSGLTSRGLHKTLGLGLLH